jgi:hypothetical protein
MSFTLYHAFHTPKLAIDSIRERDLGDGLREVTAVISNTRLMPTHSSQDLLYKIERPDQITLSGAKVVAGMVVDNPDLNLTTEQKTTPETIAVRNIPGLGTVAVRWIIQGGGNYTVTVDSRKSGTVSRSR